MHSAQQQLQWKKESKKSAKQEAIAVRSALTVPLAELVPIGITSFVNIKVNRKHRFTRNHWADDSTPLFVASRCILKSTSTASVILVVFFGERLHCYVSLRKSSNRVCLRRTHCNWTLSKIHYNSIWCLIWFAAFYHFLAFVIALQQSKLSLKF